MPGTETDARRRLLRIAGLADDKPWRRDLRDAVERGDAAEMRRLAGAASNLARLHGIEAPPQARDLRKLLFAAKRRVARDALSLARAESSAAPEDPAFVEADRLLAETPEPKLPVGGADLVRLGVPSGPRVGAILDRFNLSRGAHLAQAAE